MYEYIAVDSNTGEIVASASDKSSLQYYIGRYMLANGIYSTDLTLGDTQYTFELNNGSLSAEIRTDERPIRTHTICGHPSLQQTVNSLGQIVCCDCGKILSRLGNFDMSQEDIWNREQIIRNSGKHGY